MFDKLESNEILKTTPRMRNAARIHAIVMLLVTPLAIALVIYSVKKYGYSHSDLLMWTVWHLIGALAPTLSLHRYFTHKSFSVGPHTADILAVLAMTTMQGPIVYWVANHRFHHRYSDRETDIHSPVLSGGAFAGFWQAHMGWMFNDTQANPHRYARNLLSNARLMKLNRLYPLWVILGLIIPALIGFVVIGGLEGVEKGLIWGGVLRLATVHHATFSVNSFGHLVGRRRFKLRDNSRNVWWLCLITLGEGWHNNHHAAPSSARQGLTWYEIDIAYLVIKVMERLGLAWDIRVAKLDNDSKNQNLLDQNEVIWDVESASKERGPDIVSEQ